MTKLFKMKELNNRLPLRGHRALLILLPMLLIFAITAIGQLPVTQAQEENEQAGAGVFEITVTVEPVEGGTVSVTSDPSGQAESGSVVTVNISDIEFGKQLKTIRVQDADDNIVVITEVSAGSRYNFTMPAKAVTVIVELEATPTDEQNSSNLDEDIFDKSDLGNDQRIQSNTGTNRFLILPFNDPGVIFWQGWRYYWSGRDQGLHRGIDYIKRDSNNNWVNFDVLAAADGVAMQSTQYDANGKGFGKFVLVRHQEKDSDGRHYFTLYAHLESVETHIVSKNRGDTNYGSWTPVKAGDKIGVAGRTGSEHLALDQSIHLHFEVNRGGYVQNKTDPYGIYKNKHEGNYPAVNSGDTCPNQNNCLWKSLYTGSIQVNINPSAANTAGAQWRLANVQLLTPQDASVAGGSTIDFTWSSVGGATRHQIEIDQLSGSSWSSFRRMDLGNVASTNVSGFLENGAQYRWRIRAGTASSWLPWTPYRTFTNTRSTTDGVVIELRWTKPNDARTDVDLHFTRPGGTFARRPGCCYYGNRRPDWGLPGVTADNPWLDRDDRQGPGPEIITLPSPYETGDYAVRVRHYSGGLPTTASVKIWIRGVLLYNGSRTLTSNKQIWHVADIRWPAGSVIVRNTVSQETLSNDLQADIKEKEKSDFDAIDESEDFYSEPVAGEGEELKESNFDKAPNAEIAGYSTAWQNSGATLFGLDPGTYTIEFRDIPGWTKPANITVTLGAGENAVRTGTYNPASTWSKIAGSRASILAVDNGQVVGSFPGLGVYRYTGSSWQKLAGTAASALAFDNGVVVGSFPGLGVYRHSGGSWQQLAGTAASALAFDNGVVVGSFSGRGVFRRAGGSWQPLTSTPAGMLAYDGGVIAAYFPTHGVYIHDGSWRQLTTARNIEALAYKDGLLVVSNASGVYVYE